MKKVEGIKFPAACYKDDGEQLVTEKNKNKKILKAIDGKAL